MRVSRLLAVARWLTVVLIIRVLGTILANYPDYFPPNFDSLFLQGRELTFHGAYRVAFYIHIISAPLVLVNGLILLSTTVLVRFRRLHRQLGWLQIVVLLLFMLPSSVVMAGRSFGGWPSGVSFVLLSLATASCAIIGVRFAIRRQFERHRCWMVRCFVLLSSAIMLRLISGAAGLLGVANPELAYILAAWASWLIPLSLCVSYQHYLGFTQIRMATTRGTA